MFGWDDAFILSMQAAGAIFNISQAKEQRELLKQGQALQNASFEANLAAIRAQSSEESAAALQRVRENVSTQIVTNAARGTASGAGSAFSAIQKSEQNFNADEQVRRLNLLSKENELRANNVLSGLHTLQSETQVGQSLTNQIFNRLPIAGIGKKVGSAIGKSVDSVGTFIGKKAGFGLNTIGS